MPHALADPQWLARNPQARADDLHAAFVSHDIAGIIASIGGDDGVRVLPFIDDTVLRANPKVFMGFSDTTVFHFLAYRAGLQTFYGPSVMAGFAENGGMLGYAERWVRKTVMNPDPVGPLEPAAEWTEERLEWKDPSLEGRRRTLRRSPGWVWLQGQGRVEGRLRGGCLDVLEWLKGTPWWPPLEAWRGDVFYWETSEEAPKPFEVLRWLRNYALQGIAAVISAMLVGRPRDDSDDEHRMLIALLRQFATDELGRPELPIIAEMDFGHTDPMLVLPNGGRMVVDCETRTVTLPDPSVLPKDRKAPGV